MYFLDDASDSLDVQEKGLRSIRDLNDQSHGGRVNISLQSVEKYTAYGVSRTTIDDTISSMSEIIRFSQGNGVSKGSGKDLTNKKQPKNVDTGNESEKGRIKNYNINLMRTNSWNKIILDFFRRFINHELKLN